MVGEEQSETPLTRSKAAGRAAAAIGVGAAVFVLATASLVFTQQVGGLAAVWPANAVVLAAILRSRSGAWRSFLAAAFAGDLAANLVIGDGALEALALAACDLLEAGLFAWFIRAFAGEAFDLGRQKHILLFLFASVGLVLVTAVPAALALVAIRHEPFLSSLLERWGPDALGYLVLAPCLLALTAERWASLRRRIATPRGAIAAAVLAVPLALVNLQDRLPVLFAIPAALILVAFELELAGAALALLLTAGAALIAAASPHGPVLMSRYDPQTRLWLVQALLLSLTVSILPVASAIERRRRLERALSQSLVEVEAARAETAKAYAYSQLAEQLAGVGYWRRDFVTGEMVWSDEMYAIHGLEKGRHQSRIGEELALYQLEDRRLILRTVQQSMETGAPFELKARLNRACDGAERIVIFKGGVELGQDGAARAVFGVTRDITEEEESRRRVEESESRYRLLADLSSDVVVCSDLDGAIRYVSPAISRYGYVPETLIGQDGAQFVHPEDLDHVGHAIQALIRNEAEPPTACAYRFRSADGAYAWVETVFSMVRDGKGALVGFNAHVRDITERHAAAEALADSEARYRLLADASSDIIFTNDADGIIRYASPSVRRYGHEPDALVGRNAREVIHPDDYRKVLGSVLAQIAGEPFDATWDRTYRFRTGDGGYVWVEGAASIVRDEAGEMTSVVSQLRDVSDRHAAIQALADSEARYRLLADASTDIVIKVDRNDVIEYVSASVRRYGYDPDQLIGVSGFSLVHPDDLPKLQDLISELFTAGVVDPSRDRSHRLRDAAGGYVWVEGNPSIIRDAAGAPIAVVSQLRDVSERIAATQALAESELRYRLIAENVTDVVSRSDARGRFLYLSPSVAEVTGYTPEELLGDTFLPFIHPDDIEPVMDYYASLAAAGSRADRALRYRARHKDGRWIWLECHPSMLRDPGGRIREFIDVTRDITRSVRLEAELMAARDSAEKAAAVKAAFVANMSHEIRTPLTAILGFTRLLGERSDLGEEARKFVGRISGAGSALLAIVNDVLDFSKLEAGQFEIRPRVVSPAEAASDALMLFTPQARAKGLELIFEAGAGLPALVSLDPDRLRQIVLNLVSNAIKFTDKGSVTLSASWEAGMLDLRVRDTGSGMNRAQQRKLFQRFSQVDASPAGRNGGTGLGLAICKGLAEAMGGSISVTSQPGHGSEFRVRVAAPLADAADAGAEEVPASIEGLRLLLVDDNAANRELARAILTPFGVEVTEAADGFDAITAAQASPFDAILMDIRMPRLDGPTAAARIRAEPGPNREAPILAFSADADLTADSDGFAFDGVVRKPLSPAELIGGLQRCL